MVQRSGCWWCWQWLCYTVYPCIPCFQTKSSTFVYNLDDLQIEFFAWMITLSGAELKVHFLCGFISSQPARTTWSIFHVLTPFSIVCRDIKICQSNSKHHCWLPHAEQCWPAAGLQDLCSSSFARGGVGQLAPRPELLVKSVISEYQRAYFKKEKMHEHLKLPANVWFMGLYHSISRKSCLMTHALTFLSSSTDKHRLLQVQPISRYCCAGCRLVPQTAEQHLEIAVGYRLSVIPWENRVEEFYFAAENRDEVGYESCVGSLERSDMSGTLYTEIRKQQTEGHDFREIIQRDQGDQGEGEEILTGIQWWSRQDVLCTVYKCL